MSGARDVRRCALQAMYQLDAHDTAVRRAGGTECEEDPAEAQEMIRRSLADSAGTERTHQAGYDLAVAAWARRAEADEAVARLTPDWPTHRQPAIDRCILRLAWHELTVGPAPPKVVINEAVELAKEFSTERSPMFVNGVLDKLYRLMRDEDPEDPGAAPDAAHPLGDRTAQET